MSKFTFNLSKIGQSIDTNVGAALSSGTRNEDLTYTGDDAIVWDRINTERQRRGLPGLTDIGNPRPPLDANESSVVPSNKPSETFEVNGPPGLTLDQARAAFEQQAKTGSLVGLKPGSVLSAATQAAAGLGSAQALLAQAQSGITGALGAGIQGATGAIGSISKAIGAAGGALNGAVSGIAAGLSGAVGAAAQSITSIAGTAVGAVTSAVGAVARVGSVASTAIGTLNRTLSTTPVTAPVDLVNYAKQVPALTSISNMSQSTVTGVLAQTKNLVGQASNVLSNTKGLGEFGLDVSQLERAGVVKPGTASLVAAGSSITNILKSPAVFTGKDGIKSATDLLSSVSKQTGIQQQLMSQGINQLSAVGIPVKSLSVQGLAGVAANAAKSVAGTESLLKNLPVPAGVTAGFTDAFNKNIRDGAFAANFSETKVPLPFKAEVVPTPAEQTVQRPTVNAASARVIGNDKVPEPNYGPPTPDPTAAGAAESEIKRLATEIAALLAKTARELASLDANISYLESQQNITDAQWEAVNAERIEIGKRYNPLAVPLNSTFTEIFNSAPEDIRRLYLPVGQRITQGFRDIVTAAVDAKDRVNELSKKRQGPPADATA